MAPSKAGKVISDEKTFNTPDAPTFYPTEEQWKDPTAYLWSIRQEGARCANFNSPNPNPLEQHCSRVLLRGGRTVLAPDQIWNRV